MVCWSALSVLVPQVCAINTNSKMLAQIAWCPTRRGCLASITRDEHNVKFWDMQAAMPQPLAAHSVKSNVIPSLNKPFRGVSVVGRQD